MKKRTKNFFINGFTMIEMLVVLGTITLLSSTLIIYSRSGERQLVLFKEQAKVVGFLIKARSLSINTYGEVNAPCDYGVYFKSPDTAILFKEYSPTKDPNCQDINRIYDLAEKVEEIKIDSTVKFGDLGLANVVFIPPDPQVIIDNNPGKSEAVIKIQALDGSSEKIIKITNAGQITTQ